MSTRTVPDGSGSADQEVMQLLREKEKPFVTANDIADDLGVTRQYAHSRLSELEAAGEIEKEQVGARAVVWWVRE